MNLSPARVQIIANTEPFQSRLAQMLVDMAPLLWRLSLIRQRRRSRLITRNKQRRNW